jgi:hypothetical protein
MTEITTFVIEAVGWLGAMLVLGAYILLVLERVDSRSPRYQWMNVIGSAGFIVNSGWNGAIPSATLNTIWLGMGLYALAKIRRGGARGEESGASGRSPS